MSEEAKKEDAPKAEEAPKPKDTPQEEQAAETLQAPAEKKAEESPQTEAPKTQEAPKAESIQGKVKWFSNVKGYGFLQAEGQERDIFVHYSSIQGEGYKTLNENEEVTFEVVESGKGPQAANVVRAKKQAEKEDKEAKS